MLLLQRLPRKSLLGRLRMLNVEDALVTTIGSLIENASIYIHTEDDPEVKKNCKEKVLEALDSLPELISWYEYKKDAKARNKHSPQPLLELIDSLLQDRGSRKVAFY